MPPRPTLASFSDQVTGMYNPGEAPFPNAKVIRRTMNEIIPVRYGEEIFLHRPPPPLAPLTAVARPAGTSLGSAHWIIEAGPSQKAVLLGPTTTLTSLHPQPLDLTEVFTQTKNPQNRRTILTTNIRADPAFPVQNALDRLCTRVLKTLQTGGTVLIAQWPWASHFILLDALITLTSNAQMGHVPILVVGRQGDRARMYSDILGEWMGPGGRQQMYSPASPLVPAGLVERRRLRYISSPGDPSFHAAYQEPSIIFAGDPYILAGPSKILMDIWRGKVQARHEAFTEGNMSGGSGSGPGKVITPRPLHYMVILPEPEAPVGDILRRHPPIAPGSGEESRLDIEAIPVDVRLTPSQFRHDLLEQWGRREGGDTWVLGPRVWGGQLPSQSLQLSTLYPPMLEVGREPQNGVEMSEEQDRKGIHKMADLVEDYGWGDKQDGEVGSRTVLPAWVSPELAKQLILLSGEIEGADEVTRIRAQLSWRNDRWELLPWSMGTWRGEGNNGGSRPRGAPLSLSSPFQKMREGQKISEMVYELYEHLNSKGLIQMICTEEEGQMGKGWYIRGRLPQSISHGWFRNGDKVAVWVMEQEDGGSEEGMTLGVEVRVRQALQPMTQWIQEWLQGTKRAG
ncbi:beta-lactamase-like protein [Piptocephalis cylindrospora]|uniref:Beta-lactamase-like protein n=1 Tax=Piptocephalis cylindrospora TaxID=1907219 RepID=A0A4P9Y5X1_9FUNG|nr:beta-lactamase-like protein [Piptocephalis cylindrospora]|eukprot:RKP13621.1 beta-lactamase-like protein [Piptocephalis cylindrospora]